MNMYEPVTKFVHVVINNGCYDSVGGQASAISSVNVPELAAYCGYESVARCYTRDQAC